MKWTAYLRDQCLPIVVWALAIGFVVMMLGTLGVNASARVFLAIVLAAAGVVCLLYGYFRRAGFYRDLKDRMESLDQKYLITEMIERPEFLEGKLLYDLLNQVDKSMNDKLGEYRRSSSEYREYIETWVHEVKTPIASSRLMIENNKNEVSRGLEGELSRIEGYVEQSLFYTRSNSVEKDYIIKKVNLKEMVSSCIKKNARALIESRISVQLQDLEEDVFTDAKWIDFIVGQILNNSIKYRREQDPRIKIFAEPRQNSIRLVISDNGIGIPAQDIQRVFEKGFTGENGRKFMRSTGMGLYLCKKLCGKLGLSISLASQAGQGTMIEILFPKSKMFLLENDSVQ